jgi:AmmeMemoRadiSam system protein B
MSAVEIHSSNLAGSWYPADPEELRADIERFLGEERRADPALRAILVPHAGYRYSGKTAGAAFARVGRARWHRAVVVAPSHYHAFAGAAVFPGTGFATPLGVVRIDRHATRMLTAYDRFTAMAKPYAREHSLEIELPFLQVVDPSIELVPVLVGTADDPAELAALAPGLGALDDGETLFVVSSDFTHYGAQFGYLPFSPDGADYVSAALRRLDFGAIDPICAGDADGFEHYVQATGITVCGRGPIMAFLQLCARRLTGEVAAYSTSLDVTGDYEHSVSYASLVFRPEAGAAG